MKLITKAVFSKLFTLSQIDVIKAAIVTGISSVLTGVYQTISAGSVPTGQQLKSAGLIGLISGFSYLVKNFFTGSPDTVELNPAETKVVYKDDDEHKT